MVQGQVTIVIPTRTLLPRTLTKFADMRFFFTVAMELRNTVLLQLSCKNDTHKIHTKRDTTRNTLLTLLYKYNSLT